MTQVCEKFGVYVRYQKGVPMNRASINWYKSYKKRPLLPVGGPG